MTVAEEKLISAYLFRGHVWIEMCISPNRTNPLIPPPGSPETESPNRVFQDSRVTSLKSRQTVAGLLKALRVTVIQLVDSPSDLNFHV